MSDEQLRDLELAWRRSRDPQDEARLLAERLRAGRLPLPRLELVAYAGHAPARAALGEAAPAGRRVPWAAWVAAVDDEGRGALARGLVDLVQAEPDLRADAPLDHALDGLEEWLACPCPTHAAPLRALRDGLRVVVRLEDGGPELARHPPDVVRRAAAVRALGYTIVLALTPGRDAVEGALRFVVDELVRAPEPRLRPAPALGPLLAWALGPAHAHVPGAAPEDPAAYLRARLLRGDWVRDRVLLAAYAGDADARAALGDAAPTAPTELEPWLAGLADPSLRPRVVAAVAGHVLSGPLTRAWLGAPVTPRAYAVRADVVRRAREACDALRRFAEDPGADGALATHGERLAEPGIDRAAPDERAQRLVEALRAALDGALGGTPVDAALEAILGALPRDAREEAGLVARGVVAAWALGEA